MSLPFNRVGFGKSFHGSIRLSHEVNKVGEPDARPPRSVRTLLTSATDD